jgi:tetratricopeptide (TPR) repeat protein
MGIILVKKRQYKEGLVYLETASTLAPNDADILYSLAEGYAKTNRPEEAVSALAKAKTVNPKDLKLRTQLYKMYMKLDRNRDARKEVEELLALNPTDMETRTIYARMLFEDGKYKEAATEVENIMAAAPSNEILMLSAQIKTAEKDYEGALAVYEEIISMDNYAPALYEKAELFRNYNKELKKSPKWAQTFYERALRADSTFALAELGLARLQKLWKRNDLYLEHLERAHNLDPDNKEIQQEWKKAGK